MATITEDYVSFEVAKLLKEKGFNEECSRWYVANESQESVVEKGFGENQFYINAPTLQMAMKWLREKHLLHISIDMMNGGRWEYEIDGISVPFDGGVLPEYYCNKIFSNYEEAADDAIKYCLEKLI